MSSFTYLLTTLSLRDRQVLNLPSYNRSGIGTWAVYGGFGLIRVLFSRCRKVNEASLGGNLVTVLLEVARLKAYHVDSRRSSSRAYTTPI
jgi:hypothetical protein